MPAFLAGPLLSPGVAAAVAAGAAAASALIIDMTKENRLSVEEITRLARAKASDAAAAAAAVSGLDAADVKTAKDYAMAILPIDQIQAMLDAIEAQATASMGAGEKRSAKEQWDELRSLLNQVKTADWAFDLVNAVRYNPLRVLDPNFHVEVAAVWQRVNDLTIYIGQKMDQLAVLLEEEAQKAQQWLDEQDETVDVAAKAVVEPPAGTIDAEQKKAAAPPVSEAVTQKRAEIDTLKAELEAMQEELKLKQQMKDLQAQIKDLEGPPTDINIGGYSRQAQPNAQPRPTAHIGAASPIGLTYGSSYAPSTWISSDSRVGGAQQRASPAFGASAPRDGPSDGALALSTSVFAGVAGGGAALALFGVGAWALRRASSNGRVQVRRGSKSSAARGGAVESHTDKTDANLENV